MAMASMLIATDPPAGWMRPEPCRTNDPEAQDYIRGLQSRFANDTNIIILDSSIPMPGTEDITADTLWPARHLTDEQMAKIREEAERDANEYENGSRNAMFMVNPPLPVWRSVAEWEEHDAVMIAVRAPNIIGVPFEFLACITNDRPGSPGREVHFMGPLGAQANIINLMTTAGANMSRVVYLQNHSSHTSSIWTRDFGPLFSVLEDGSVFMADFIYQRTWNNTPNLFGREGDQNVHTYATAKGWEHGVAFGRHAHAGHEGGNHLTDGKAGGVFKGTSGVHGVGAGNNPVAARETLTNWFGVDHHWIYNCPISTPFVPGSPWGGIAHVDCYAKFLRPDVMFISNADGHTSPPVIIAAANLNAMAANHKEKTTSYGTLMKVERAVAPSMQPYANTWIMNNRVYVPVGPWNSPGTIFPHPPVDWQQVDANMLQMLANNMPGYIIIGVPNATSLPWRNEDALHCRVKEIARRDVLHAQHPTVPLQGFQDWQPSVEVQAIIRGNALTAPLNPASIQVRWRFNEQTTWQHAVMTPCDDEDHLFTATITGIVPGATLHYYITAQDTADTPRIINLPWIGAPMAYVSHWNLGSASDLETEREGFDVVLEWTHAAGVDSDEFIGYRVYRNNVFLIATIDNTFIDVNAPFGLNTYGVRTVWEAGEMPPITSTIEVGVATIITHDFIGPITGWTSMDQGLTGHPWHRYETYHALTGDYVMRSVSRGMDPSNWLISPRRMIPAGTTAKLIFYVRSSDPNRLENYRVSVSRNGTPLSQFTHHEFTGVAAYGWTRQTIDLSHHAGHNVNIAFRHFDSADRGGIMIDRVWLGTSDQKDIVHNPAQNPTAVQKGHNVILTLENPLPFASSQNLLGFRIMRNDLLIAPGASGLTFIDVNPPVGTQTYTITAVYYTGISASVTTEITVVPEALNVSFSAFSAVPINDGASVEVSWVTATETSLSGFHVYRNTVEDTNTAQLITGQMISATNTSMINRYSVVDDLSATTGEFFYWIRVIGNDQTSRFHGPARVTIVEEILPDMPEATTLSSMFPNPMSVNDTANFNVGVKEGETATLMIFNIRGQLVHEIKDIAPGFHTLTWNGRDRNNREVANGVYFYRLSSQSTHSVRRMVIIK